MKVKQIKDTDEAKKIEKSKNNIKQLVKGLVLMDILVVLNLFLQIYLKDVSYVSLAVIIVCNIIVFTTYKMNK